MAKRDPFDDDFGDRTPFVTSVLEIVASIPKGKVMTYGEIAATLGSGGARAVGTVMARYGSEVPWWRVVRSGGLPPRDHDERARTFYEKEKTPLLVGTQNYRVDLRRARFVP